MPAGVAMQPLRCASLTLGLLLAAASLASAALTSAELESPGPARVEVFDLRWSDPARQRELPLRVRLPDAPGARPLVLFSHGLGGSVDAGRYWGEHWSSHGLAVIHLQHPGSDTSVWQGAQRPARGLQQAASGEQLIARALDVKFVLDELARRQGSADAADAWTRRLDLQRIGMSGHSFGAMTTQAIAGQSYGRRNAPLIDERPRAFIALSPSGKDDDRKAYAAIRRPLLGVSGSEDGEVGLGLGVPPAQRRRVYELLPAGDKYLLWLSGADHMVFNGAPRFKATWNTNPPPALDELHIRLTQATMLAFWRAYLLDDPAARQWLTNAADYVSSAGELRSK